MRVATYNILHGAPLRDSLIEAATDGTHRRPGRRRGTGPDPEVSRQLAEATAALGDPMNHLDDDVDPETLTAPGADPSTRVRWSPEVPDPSELIRSIAELEATGPLDVLGLQEVDVRQERSGGVDQAAVVAEAMGATAWRFVPSIVGVPGIAAEGANGVPATEHDDWPPLPNRRRPGGSDTGPAVTAPPDSPTYGIALISRYPVREWRIHRFPPAPHSLPLLAPTTGGRRRAVRVPDEPRVAVAAIVEAPSADITVATAHLSFVPGYNTSQLKSLRAFLAGLPRPLVLMGDFNIPGRIPPLITGWEQVARMPTYPVGGPRIQFDHVLADGWTPAAVTSARRTARSLPLPVSDHCALVVDFPQD